MELTDITSVAQSVIALSFIIITLFIIPLIKNKLDADNLAELQKWITIGVGMAEQLAKNGVINKDERKKKVLAFLQSKGLTIDLQTIDAMIEAEVLKLPSLSDAKVVTGFANTNANTNDGKS